MSRLSSSLWFLLLFAAPLALSQDASRDGAVRNTEGHSFEAWDAASEEWVDPETFWDRYAARRGGLTWGKRNDYPPYADVSELDTLVIELEQGPCLMEFFHRRWRRANDIRRWDDAFNAYGGCPHVFD